MGEASKELLESLQTQGEIELEIFDSEAIIDLVEFKWNYYGYFVHYLGASMHIFFILSLTIYIYTTYLTGTYGEADADTAKFLLVICIIYPFVYDTFQLYK